MLKNSIPLSNDSAISRVVTTAASGNAFPIGFPSTTISGTTFCVSNPQKCVPSRPKPTCTSSAMQTPPAARTCRYASAKYSGGNTICPPTLGNVSGIITGPFSAVGTDTTSPFTIRVSVGPSYADRTFNILVAEGRRVAAALTVV